MKPIYSYHFNKTMNIFFLNYFAINTTIFIIFFWNIEDKVSDYFFIFIQIFLTFMVEIVYRNKLNNNLFSKRNLNNELIESEINTLKYFGGCFTFIFCAIYSFVYLIFGNSEDTYQISIKNEKILVTKVPLENYSILSKFLITLFVIFVLAVCLIIIIKIFKIEDYFPSFNRVNVEYNNHKKKLADLSNQSLDKKTKNKLYKIFLERRISYHRKKLIKYWRYRTSYLAYFYKK